MTTRRFAGGIVALVMLTVGLAGCRVPPDRLTVTTAVTGLDRPWDLGFLPNLKMVITERAGRIRLWDGTTLRTIGQPADVRVGGEGGLLGLAVDPDFTHNRYIFTCFNSTAGDVRLVRWRLNAAETTLVNRVDIVTGLPSNPSGRHSGCRPRFTQSGQHLIVGTGDAAIGSIPQNPDSLGGKTLRIDRDGKAHPGNVGVTDPLSKLDDRIYTYGHRNVQGIAIRPTDGTPFSVEHGTGCDDEVNRLVTGGNYGWDPAVPGNPWAYDESKPMTDTTKYPNARVAVWSSGCPTIAPSGATFLTGHKWIGWQNALAVAVLKDHHVHVFWFDPQSGNRLANQWSAISDRGRLRSAVQGPDGNLYLATDVAGPGGSILRVVPTQDPGG